MTPTRADFPKWRLPFPTLPTISGKRPASRNERRLAKKQRRLVSDVAWFRALGRRVMAEAERLQRLTPEEAATDGQRPQCRNCNNDANAGGICCNVCDESSI